MPASDSRVDPDTQGRGGRLLTAVFWAGVCLAPLAALLLLLGHGGALRVAAVLALLSVVLIGVSITLRREVVRDEVEDVLFDEVDMLRQDVRADITTAARATHRAFGEKLQVLYENIEGMRGQLDALQHARWASHQESWGDRRPFEESPRGAGYWVEPAGEESHQYPVSGPQRSASVSPQWGVAEPQQAGHVGRRRRAEPSQDEYRHWR